MRNSRKSEWFLTYNKRENEELIPVEELKEKLKQYEYFGILHNKESNNHYHIYIYNKNTIRFDTIQNKLAGVHIDQVRGTRQEIYNYLLHNNTDKEKYTEDEIFTNIEDLKGFLNKDKIDMDKDIVEMAINGANTKQILLKYPCNWRSIDKIVKLVEICNFEAENTEKGHSNGTTF